MKPQMNTDRCSSVLLTCKSMSGGQRYFHREGAKSAKKSDFKNFAFFASSRWIFWVAAMLRRVHRSFHFVQLPLRSSRLRGEFGLSFTAKARRARRNREDFLG